MKNHSAALEPLTVQLGEAVRITGISRAELYRRLAKGDLRAVKSGNRTLIVLASLKDHVAALPEAKFRAPTNT